MCHKSHINLLSIS